MQFLRRDSRCFFETLSSHHSRSDFDCGKPALNEFLGKQARQNADRNLGVTHVVVESPGASTICAYYTLVTRTVEAEIVPRKGLPRGSLGVVLLGRLAVDKRHQGRGLGKRCLIRALQQTSRAASEIGIYALVVDAKDEEARNWYHHLEFGFETLLDDPDHLFITVDTIRKVFG
ncbi:MAG: GNAT family N-acetyltransferase [Fimbriimonas sp.]